MLSVLKVTAIQVTLISHLDLMNCDIRFGKHIFLEQIGQLLLEMKVKCCKFTKKVNNWIFLRDSQDTNTKVCLVSLTTVSKQL